MARPKSKQLQADLERGAFVVRFYYASLGHENTDERVECESFLDAMLQAGRMMARAAPRSYMKVDIYPVGTNDVYADQYDEELGEWSRDYDYDLREKYDDALVMSFLQSDEYGHWIVATFPSA